MKLNIDTLLTSRAKSDIIGMLFGLVVYGSMCLYARMHFMCQYALRAPICTYMLVNLTSIYSMMHFSASLVCWLDYPSIRLSPSLVNRSYKWCV